MAYVSSWAIGVPKILSIATVFTVKMRCIPLNLILWGGYKLTF